MGLTFAAAPEPGDDHVLADMSGLPICIADGVRSVLDQAVIDVAPDDGESGWSSDLRWTRLGENSSRRWLDRCA